MKLKLLSIGMLLTWLLLACAAPIVEVDQTGEETAAIIIEEPLPTSPPPNKDAEVAEMVDEETAMPATSEPEPTATPVPAPTKVSLAASLPRISKAPDITNETWLNSEPMTLAGQEGKVVLVEFWTYT